MNEQTNKQTKKKKKKISYKKKKKQISDTVCNDKRAFGQQCHFYSITFISFFKPKHFKLSYFD